MHPGTPAARMKKVPSTEVKKRSRELTSLFESFAPYQGMEGQIESIWITEIATDGVHLVRQVIFFFSLVCLLVVKGVNLSWQPVKAWPLIILVPVWITDPDRFSHFG